jgi:hypothetical protein
VYDLDTLQAGMTGKITITDSVMCGNESIRGLTQCVKATISPKSDCPVDAPLWDSSYVAVSGHCKDTMGNVEFKIHNMGEGNMTDSAWYKVYSNAALADSVKYMLDAGDSVVLNVAARGNTIRLEAYNTLGNPFKTYSTHTVEGCIADGDSISTGYVTLLPMDDTELEVDISCGVILDSYDPNDKQVWPSGILDGNYIPEDSDLTYLIRFQNTGTDTAYRIVVSDTLDANLDMAAFEQGAVSHPYRLELNPGEDGQGTVLNWVFEDIYLVDSTTDEPKSHGFINFRIAPYPKTPKRTVIKNKAAIYFDFNSAIITNEPFVTLLDTVVTNDDDPIEVEECWEGIFSEITTQDQTIAIEPMNGVTLMANEPPLGSAKWTVISGTGFVDDDVSSTTSWKNLSEGENQAIWSVTSCGIVETDTVKVKLESVSGLESLLFDNLSIYPNPTSGKLNIQFESGYFGQVGISAFDVTGKQVMEVSGHKVGERFSHQFEMNRLGNGLYILKLSAGGNTVQRKVVLK